MVFGQDRTQLRKMYFDAWSKYQSKQILSPLESIISDVIAIHPEYHVLFDSKDETVENNFNVDDGQINPFLHLGLHIAIREQIQAKNPPIGIQTYDRLICKGYDPHDIEHKMLDCLAETIWLTQKNNSLPDENAYSECLKNLN